MNNKKKLSIIMCIIIFIVIGICITKFFVDSQNKSNANVVIKSEDKEDIEINNVEENKYYIIYVRNGDNSSSFIPLTLNKDYKLGDEYSINISTDDNGNIINDDKIIAIDDFVISEETKEKIKSIAGEDKYDEAIKEIQTNVDGAKEQHIKDGRKNNN